MDFGIAFQKQWFLTFESFQRRRSKKKSWVDQLVFMNIEIKLVGKIINIVFVIYCLSP